ncbi:unnamed protein product [Blepharisma stoltei]|uniref:Uncharacterized protein n=1 Tax=Blepharisma stoltei TaxID=1481888 RepID=A0AAU9K2Y5_9CILI|nr:unnamed protein product [Blepharisma stoltei]
MNCFIVCIKAIKKKSTKQILPKPEETSNSPSSQTPNNRDHSRSLSLISILSDSSKLPDDSVDLSSNVPYVQRKRPKVYNLRNNSITVRHTKTNEVVSSQKTRFIRILKNCPSPQPTAQVKN